MNTVDLLKALYPPVSYDMSAPLVDATVRSDAAVFDGVLGAAMGLLDEMHPNTTKYGLVDWERVYGLPDPCLKGKATSFDVRRSFLLARFNDRGGIRNEDAIARVRDLLGIDVTITEFEQATCASACDVGLYLPDWRYVWRVNSPEVAAVWRASCTDTCVDPLSYFDNAALLCVLKTHAPSGSLPYVSYGVLNNATN